MRISKVWKRCGAIGIAVGINEIAKYVGDIVMFPTVIGLVGIWKGWPLLLLLCLILNYLTILAYRKIGLGEILKWLDDTRNGLGESWWQKLVAPLLRLGHIPTVAFLTFEDPAKGFVYARSHVLQSDGFTKGDWLWYFLANFFGVTIWVWGWGAILTVLKWSWNFMMN